MEKRKDGHSKLVYDKATRTIVRVDPHPETAAPDQMQIEHMVARFLNWRLPEEFYPDCGISFEGTYKGMSGPVKHEPVGTNLFSGVQAEAMVRHMLEGLPLRMKETDSLRAVVDFVDSWVSNPVSAYSHDALQGLFSATRDRIAALSGEI